MDVVARDRQLTAGRQNYFVIGPPCLDDGQIRQLRITVDANPQPAETHDYGPESRLRRDLRRTVGCSLDRTVHRWVYDIIESVCAEANKFLRYDIVAGRSDPIQLLRYDAEEKGCFVWHADTVPSDLTRKISVVVPLSRPDEYEGGVLQFAQGGVVTEPGAVPGRPVVFPSWLTHQVTPVTAGRRYSLVAWMRGPNWR
jgi:PKHD-type hydroxylase